MLAMQMQQQAQPSGALQSSPLQPGLEASEDMPQLSHLSQMDHPPGALPAVNPPAATPLSSQVRVHTRAPYQFGAAICK